MAGLLQITSKVIKAVGAAFTATFVPGSNTGVVTVPTYRDHLVDLFNSRQSSDSRALIKELLKHDPDVSAAANAYLTLANTDPVIVARALDGSIDREATKTVYEIITLISRRWDYTLGFQLRPDLSAVCESMRSMLLMRGCLAVEAIVDKAGLPSEVRLVDPASLEWVEKTPGLYKPQQIVQGQNKPVPLDIPSFFVTFFRRDPTSIYSFSPFVSSINTIAARQQVINDLYRIMRITGFPRMELIVLEEVLLKNVPPSIKMDNEKTKDWMRERLQEVAANFANIRADQAFAHFDSVQAKILGDRKVGAELDITAVIETLNSQNQAALKTMATVIGRGNSGVNTASVEARIAAMNADELNDPVAEALANVLSFFMHLQGTQGYVEVKFRRVEMRPELELEPQLTMRAARLQQDLSLGIINDDEYHLAVYGRIRPDDAEELMGTGFMAPAAATVDTGSISPNSDPLGRSLAPEGGKSAKSKTVKKSGSSASKK